MNSTFEYILKKFDLKLNAWEPIAIPNMGRDQLPLLLAELGFKTGAEIGVERGIYSEIILKANPQLHLYSIDPWKASAYEPGIHGVDQDQDHFDSYYKVAKKRLAPYKNCEIIRKVSLVAVKDFPDESLDFVYIDANHEFVEVASDLHAWKKKVRPGGIVSGHDYAYYDTNKHNHVKYVLHAYTNSYKIHPLFVVGAKEMNQPGIIRDKFRSWFFVKT